MADININSSSVSGKSLRRSDEYHNSRSFRYVDTVTGSDNSTHSGSQYFPWATLTRAFDQIEDGHDIKFSGSETTGLLSMFNKTGVRVTSEHGATITGNVTFTSCTDIVVDLDIIGNLTFSGCTGVYVKRGENLASITALGHNGILDITGAIACNITVDTAGTDTEVLMHENQGRSGRLIWTNGATGATTIKNSQWSSVENDGSAGALTTRLENSYSVLDRFTGTIGSMDTSRFYTQTIDTNDPVTVRDREFPTSEAVIRYVTEKFDALKVTMAVASSGSNICVIATENDIYSAIPDDGSADPKRSGRAGVAGQPPLYGIDGINKVCFTGISTQKVVASLSTSDVSIALFDNGELWGWGRNASGALGVGDKASKAAPVLSKTDVAEIITTPAAMQGNKLNTTLIVKDVDGFIWGAGNNRNGVLGLGDDNEKVSWTRLDWAGGGCKAFQLGCAFNTLKVQRSDGRLFACGYNGWGVFGVGTPDSSNTPVDVTDEWFGVGNTFEVTHFAGAAGGHDGSLNDECSNMLAYDDGNGNKVLRFAGSNASGQAGIGSNDLEITTPVTIAVDPDIKQIAVIGGNPAPFYCLTDSGKFYAWGSNAWGALNVGDRVNRNLAEVRKTGVEEILKTSFGVNTFNTLTNVFVRYDDGFTYGCGCNLFGGLGYTFNQARQFFFRVLIRERVTSVGTLCYNEDGNTQVNIFTTEDGAIYACGSGDGQSITMKTTDDIVSPIRLFKA